MSGNNVLVIGATSSMAQPICHTLIKYGYGLTLAARDQGELELLAKDINTRYETRCGLLVADVLDPYFSPVAFIDQAGDFDHLVIAIGDMGNPEVTDLANLAFTMHINYTLPAQLATVAALKLSEKNVTAKSLSSSIVIISSVAGDRGRQSNYAYGSAKAALSTFASGLRNRFFKKGVHVMTVKPGFVDTPMTWAMNSPLIASREDVAHKIVAAMRRKKNVVYVPGFWRLIMLIILHIPENIFKRLSL